MQHDQARLALDAATRAARYLDPDHPVDGDDGTTRAGAPPAFPSAEALAGLDQLPAELADEPVDPAAVLALLDTHGSPATARTNGGRYFGFVNGGTDPAGLGAAVLAAAWDQNAALPVMSPVAGHLDAVAARWITELLGLEGAEAAFCAGASVANLTAVCAARDALLERAGWSVADDGLVGAPPLHLVATAEVHVSVLKALRVAGLGTAGIVSVPTDGCGRLIATELPPLGPRSLVLTQAGNVNTGHSDPFEPIIAAAREAGAWVHVDGAFGLWAAAAPERRHLVAGVEGADSWATDGHKWLNTPYDCGIALCARSDDLRRSMATDAAYLAHDGARAAMHLGVQMSQRARGVETWAVLASRGRRGIADLVETTCRRATDLAERLDAAGVEILAPVVLNQALAHLDDDATTDAVLAAVQADGTIWAGGTTWQGRRAIRLSVSDGATTEADIAVAADTIVRSWRRVRNERRHA
ncbi:MAG: pyridoxal-dependent decarboxylase [Actinomycetota bacterium]